MSTATPAERAARRRDPTLRTPPRAPEADRQALVSDLELVIRGQRYLIGPSLEDDPDTSSSVDGAATLTLQIRDADGTLADALPDQADILANPLGVTCDLDGVVYALQQIDDDGNGLVTLTMADNVQPRLQQFSSFVYAPRDQATFRQFAYALVREASSPPLDRMRAFIPEIDDPQPIARASGQPSTKKGTGANSTYTVKGEKASSVQLRVIDGILTQAQQDGASRRVMIAAIMAATQESGMGKDQHQTGNDDLGIFQQGRNWISAAGARDPQKSTHAFLVTGPTSWKKVHGSVKTALGDLDTLITQVQNPRVAGNYAPWEREATKTVDQWLDTGGGGATVTRALEYDFTRGEYQGEREDSWACLGRLADERNVRRWAAQNVLYLVSDDELRAAAPALEVWGDEQWLLQRPAYTWAPGKPVTEVTLRVLAKQWGVNAGASVLLHGKPLTGKFLVSEVNGGYVSPERTIVLRRPTPQKPEPAHETQDITLTAGGAAGGTDLLAACQDIDGQDLPYVWGGGHAKCGTPDRGDGSDPGIGYDCSGSVAAALASAGIGKLKIGRPVPRSDVYARQYLKLGKGDGYTVWANATHIWIELTDGGRYASFDTRTGSNDTRRGPHLRTVAGSSRGFTAYH